MLSCPYCQSERLKFIKTVTVYIDTPIGVNDYKLTAFQCMVCERGVFLDEKC